MLVYVILESLLEASKYTTGTMLNMLFSHTISMVRAQVQTAYHYHYSCEPCKDTEICQKLKLKVQLFKVPEMLGVSSVVRQLELLCQTCHLGCFLCHNKPVNARLQSCSTRFTALEKWSRAVNRVANALCTH